ncbi:MAG: methionine synthase [Phycisphaeraceae bacterium]|nr:methionine synthase [Phycisphaeraceae bacterium]MCB9847776.1 methionine synthase [Phycisphaeraceae bacterium]
MNPLIHELTRRVLVVDGAMGTSIHACNCSLERDFLGKENCSEILLGTRPEVIQGIHESFLDAGCDCIETNTFGANALVLAEFDIPERSRELNRLGAQVARRACERFATPDRPRFVLGSMGPGTRLLTLGNTTWDAMLASYTEQAVGLIEGGVDALQIETCQDLLQVKCAINACRAALKESGKTVLDIPIFVSVTIETTGTMLLGTEIAAAAEALRGYPIASLGLNCATGPAEMADHVRWLSERWDRAVSVMPNAGLPELVDGEPSYPLTPAPFAEALLRFVEHGGVNIVGGCCGTTPEHIQALAEAIDGRAPAPIRKNPPPRGCTSLFSGVEFRQDTSFLIVGERTNTNGSRQFKRLLNEEDWDGLVSMGRELIRDGSHVLDVCVDYVGRDGVRDIREVVSRFAQQLAAPLMIDSTQVDVLEEGLRHAPGKCIINSMNLEEGEEKLGAICELARAYGAAVVAGTIDEDPDEAMAKTAERKIAIAERIHDLAINRHGLDSADLLFDPLVLPITTGVEADRRLALETIEGIRLIAQRLPKCQTMIGLSNVSFGLNPAARQVLNSVFLHECLEAGLTGAIVHASKILPRNRIDEVRWDAALDLIYDRRSEGFDPLTAFINLFDNEQEAQGEARQRLEDLPLEDRLQRHIIDGEMGSLEATINAAMERYKPLEIINDHLLAGMKVVGDLFGSGQMQLPFVLQSAQVMKSAVAMLEPHMDKAETKRKGVMVLATVQGDVHDIGKNLVDIILSNNGYNVINLGIKQTLPNILAAFREHEADAIGLSGLLVKSVGVMKTNLESLAEQGFGAPVILGGAALNRAYAENDLRAVYPRTYYGRDAFAGLHFMDRLTAGELSVIDGEIAERSAKRAEAVATIGAGAKSSGSATAVASAGGGAPLEPVDPPAPPFWGSKVVRDIDLETIYPFINTTALFRGQWQFKRGSRTTEEYEQDIERTAFPIFERLKESMRRDKVLRPAVVYGWFPAQSDGDDLIVFDPGNHDREIERFTFPRQQSGKRRCISDFFRSAGSGVKDTIGLTCVTMGAEVSRLAQSLFAGDEYAEYLYTHGMGVECAEALAEYWHKTMRAELGIDADDDPEIQRLFTQHYRGSRYSFGYPACPEMSDQEKLFRLLDPGRIGCALTENYQIDPEQSTSAIIVHHPEAKYFNA